MNMNMNELYQVSTLEEKRFILEALFATYSSLVNENYHSALDSLENAFSLIGENKNQAGVWEIFSNYIEIGEYGKAKSELEGIIQLFISCFGPANYSSTEADRTKAER